MTDKHLAENSSQMQDLESNKKNIFLEFSVQL